jgi:methionyl-tRNA formyltransferase
MVTSPPLRIVYFGTPAFAVPALRALIQSRHPVVALVSQPDRPRGRGHQVAPTPTKALALQHRIPVLQPTKLRDQAFMDEMSALRADLGVVAAYGRILPEPLLQIPRLGMINVHASLLPKYRGAAPIHRAVIDGETETGVTIMRLVEELDAGPMLASIRWPIAPDATSVDVERDLAEVGARLLVETVDRMAAGPVTETPQDDARATFAPKIAKSDSSIDWNMPAARIHNLVRGLQPWPMASTIIGGTRCLVHRTTIAGDPCDSGPGVVLSAGGDAIVVAAGEQTAIHILQLQPEGKRVMTAREFLSGRRIAPGTVLRSA